ncbi:hypothetical protein [Amycolatopsis rifamycinica]|uniref:Glycosyltransferase RgtA/B/C/D-like domain-containing protein n=1 Tax=Amycolatopsis rifamycinica TaxID=287986 RepID=A0A066TY39_9PSEU|nr:hypothetical protein [Amycolatopsis rifamycinica]KDN16814.1 hypothetical protein DV20_40590 [Amycolatopsis rifamycinica]
MEGATAEETVSPPAEQAPRASGRRFDGRKAALWSGRLLISEGLIAFYVGLAISLVFNHRIVTHPKSLLTGGLGDPLLWVWELGWQHHWLTHGGDFWTSNQFYPAADNYAFGETLLGYLPFSVFAGDGQYANVFLYNLLFVFCFALAFAGAYLLAKQLGSNWQGALLAGVVWAWAPWRLSHIAHLNVLSTGGIALALWALAKGHGFTFRGERGETKPRWVVAGWLLAAWQVSIGWAIGLPFVYLMALVGIAIALYAWRLGRRMVIANVVGVVAFLGIVWWLVVPFLRVRSEYGFTRTWREVEVFSPPVNGLWTAPYETWVWLETFFNNEAALPQEGAGEMLLFPGLVVAVLGIAGLFLSAWTWRVRVFLGVFVAFNVLLSLGTTLFGGGLYWLFWNFLPGWDAMRTPGRMIMWVTLGLALLAAGLVTRLYRLIDENTRMARQVIAFYMMFPAFFALIEGIPRWQQVENPGIPPDVKQVFTTTKEPIALLPMDLWSNFKYQLWSTEGFPTTANGTASNYGPQFHDMQDSSATFPDKHSIDVFKRYGIRKVVVVKSMEGAVGILQRPTAGLPLTKVESNDVVVFTLG